MESSTNELRIPQEPETEWSLEVSGEVYNELSALVRGALSVSGSIREIIPTHLAQRLEGNLSKALSTLGRIAIKGRDDDTDSERESDPIARHNAQMDRLHDEHVDRELEERANG